jgi:hypothetical protein
MGPLEPYGPKGEETPDHKGLGSASGAQLTCAPR